MVSAIFKKRQPSPSWLTVLTIVCLVVASCKKASDYNAVTSNDKTKPGVVSNIKVVNFNGGAYITYTLPDSKNILYVLANYQINSKTSRQTKSSYYSDSITVSGFADTIDYKAGAVDRFPRRGKVGLDSSNGSSQNTALQARLCSPGAAGRLRRYQH
ncbi:DUF4959 domain-containing protein [Puia sp. P3]|uniref:DUF4959 domain-containing protein n=1 Tax=Puia sp. P3 TaxID=3423952 RepID=UPI003D66F4AF